QLSQTLRRSHYDLCLTLDRSPRVGLVAWLAGIPLRAGLDSAGRGFAHNLRVPVPPIRYEPELYLDVPRALIPQTPRAKVEFTPMQFFPTAEDKAAIAQLLAEAHLTADTSLARPLIAVHPGGGNNPGTQLPSKRWPAERFAAIADRLLEQLDAQLILVGAESDSELTRAVRASMTHAASPALLDL